MKLKLTPKLALVFLLFAAALLTSVALLSYISGRGALKAAAVTELVATSGEKVAALEGWIGEREANITALARSPFLLEELAKFLEAGPDSASTRGSLVRELSTRTGEGQSFVTLFLLSPETGQVLLSTDPAEQGDFRPDRSYFREGKTRTYTTPIHLSTELGVPAMTIAAPVQSADGELLGVLVGRLNLEELNTIIQRRSGLRESDDAFLVNDSNLFVTQPRFIPDPAILQLGIHTEPVQRCLEGRNGTLTAIDYRDVPVIANYRWLPERQMCLIVKISEGEALAPVHAFGRNIGWIALIALAAASTVGLALSRTIVQPILTMQAVAQRYGRGDFEIRLPETRNDELGVLAHEFNQMAASLAEQEKQLRAHAQTLEQQVQERTAALQEINSQLQWAEEVAQTGSWEWQIPENRVRWSDGLYKVFGLKPLEFGATYEAYLAQVHAEDREFVRQAVDRAFHAGGKFEYEGRILRKDGETRHLFTRGEMLSGERGRPERMIGIAIDITERRQAEEAIQRMTADLQRSNTELEQFAYVASHDLQEPLRMISSYLQLLTRRYQGKLDSDADEFISYAVDGAKRMQNLINDLLAYSRVGTRGNGFIPVSTEYLLEDVLSNLQLTVGETSARITCDPLPVVAGDPVQLAMVFQNLLGNAIKFRGPEPPRIHISAKKEEAEWVFSVRDHGIGLDPKFADRIFVIFQRLHDRTAYPGTGIGLAICKRIVQRHGGRIWVESQPGQGTTFHFTLPSIESHHQNAYEENQ